MFTSEENGDHQRRRAQPETTFGNAKADVLERYAPGFRRGDVVDTILQSPWPE